MGWLACLVTPNSPDKLIKVTVKRGMADIQSVTLRELFNVLGLLIGFWNARAAEQDRYDWDVTLKGRRDLDANEIAPIVQTTVTVFITRVEPIGSDHRQQHAALGDLLAQDLDEIHPERDGVHVHEQKLTAELALEPVFNPSGMAGAVLAAITDENLGRHPSHRQLGGNDERYHVHLSE